ncbi:MAG: hypothetical protein QM751_07655 [Paludibacteraceae bacterium]
MKKNITATLILVAIFALSCKEDKSADPLITGTWKIVKAEPYVKTNVDSVTRKISDFIALNDRLMLDAKLTFNTNNTCDILYKDSVKAKTYLYNHFSKVLTIYSLPQVTFNTSISKDSMLLMKYYNNILDSAFLRDRLNIIDEKNTVKITNAACIFRCGKQ